MTIKRYNDIMEDRENKLKLQQEANKKKYEKIHSIIELNKKNLEKKNQETLKKHKIYEQNAINCEKKKNRKNHETIIKSTYIIFIK